MEESKTDQSPALKIASLLRLVLESFQMKRRRYYLLENYCKMCEYRFCSQLLPNIERSLNRSHWCKSKDYNEVRNLGQYMKDEMNDVWCHSRGQSIVQFLNSLKKKIKYLQEEYVDCDSPDDLKEEETILQEEKVTLENYFVQSQYDALHNETPKVIGQKARLTGSQQMILGCCQINSLARKKMASCFLDSRFQWLMLFERRSTNLRQDFKPQ